MTFVTLAPSWVLLILEEFQCVTRECSQESGPEEQNMINMSTPLFQPSPHQQGSNHRRTDRRRQTILLPFIASKFSDLMKKLKILAGLFVVFSLLLSAPKRHFYSFMFGNTHFHNLLKSLIQSFSKIVPCLIYRNYVCNSLFTSPLNPSLRVRVTLCRKGDII